MFRITCLKLLAFNGHNWGLNVNAPLIPLLWESGFPALTSVASAVGAPTPTVYRRSDTQGRVCRSLLKAPQFLLFGAMLIASNRKSISSLIMAGEFLEKS